MRQTNKQEKKKKSSDNALQSDIIYEVWETVFVKKYILNKLKENYS